MTRLSGPERKQLQLALMSAFPEPSDLAMLMEAAVDRRLSHYASEKANYRTIAFDVVRYADAQAWVEPLIAGARAEQPGNPELAAVAEALGFAPVVSAELEAMVSMRTGLHDVVAWRIALARVEGQVCHLRSTTHAGGVCTGTGFLVAPDLVLTNHHVVSHLISRTGDPSTATALFDFKRLANGRTFDAGVVCGLADDWLVSKSPPSRADTDGEGLPAADELDYALLRLDRAIGSEPASAPGTVDTGPRGWVVLPDESALVEHGDPLVIVQHPDDEPLQLAIDVVLGRNGNDTRVRYRTNTRGGSSGSPCFDLDWRLRCLHHSGDPGYSAFGCAQWNEGIPIGAIHARLDAEGLLDQLAPPTRA